MPHEALVDWLESFTADTPNYMAREINERIATALWDEPRPVENEAGERVLCWVREDGVCLPVAPPFATSLDARIPDEEIFSVKHHDRGLYYPWTVVALSRDGKHHSATAATEAVARRAAALRATRC